MTVLRSKVVINGLQKKGFKLSEKDHKYFVLFVNDKMTSIRTKVSQGSREVNDYLINVMSIQVKLDKKNFVDLVQCPLSMEDYVLQLKKQGYSFA